jgi:hypothetical protein
MKQGSTLFLKMALVGIGLIALAFCVLVVPAIGKGIGMEFPQFAYLHYPVIVGMWLAALPFFTILYQGFALLQSVDKNTAFSHASVIRLNVIKYSALVIGVLYAIGVPTFFYPVGQVVDAPGLIMMGLLIAGTPFVFAVFVSVLKRLLENAIAFKSENDLTV